MGCSPWHCRESDMSSVQFSSVTQLCPTLCNPKNCSTPGLPVYHQSHVQLFATPWIQESSWNSPDQNTGVGSLFLLQGISPIQRLNPGLLHCRQILYQLSHKGSPRILEWVAYPFSSGSSCPRNRTGLSYIAGGFFTN